MPEVADADTMAVSQVSDDLNADDSEIVPGSGTLLFINDDIIMQEITRKLLEKIGYSVLCTDNGFEALDMYIRDKEETGGTIQCLVTNITTGYFKNSDIVRTLKEIDPEANVVAMVGTEFDEDALTLKELGVTDFIRKPYSIPELSKVLAQYIV
jgi:CheY-like chemotaxis protein